MFNIRVASYLLISLIFFQSFSAVGNTLDFHAIDSQHLNEIHEHELGDNNAVKVSKFQQVSSQYQTDVENDKIDLPHNPADCHHCGHCNCAHTQWLGNANGIELHFVPVLHGFYYLTKVIEAPVSQLLRPPKAIS